MMLEVLKVLDCKVYPLMKKEQDLLRTFLSKEQEKGYIYPGSSPYIALVFFIGKKDLEEKRIIMDYRKVTNGQSKIMGHYQTSEHNWKSYRERKSSQRWT